MGDVRNQIHAALREFVYGDLEENQLERRFQRVEQEMTGANPHNIGMATFEYADKSAISDKTTREIKQALADTFADDKLPGTFPEEWDGE
jgi:hypothetical protein